MTKTNLGIYIHIPFCQKKCGYCDFLSFTSCDKYIDDYIKVLIENIKGLSKKFISYKVDSIYIGGGTPSYIDSKYINLIMNNLYKYYNIASNSENTIEANPNSLSKEKLLAYEKSKINRISLGVQSFVDKELESLGRIHKSEEVYKAMDMILRSNIDNISMDLMIGTPFQTIESLEFSLKEALTFPIKHLSVYDLIIEGNSHFNRKLLEGEDLYLPMEDENIEMFNLVKKITSNCDFNQYEISNYAYKNFQSKHNLKYWTNGNYLALGLGASSKVDDKRWKQTDNLQEFLENKNLNIKEEEYLSLQDQLNEVIFMGLRLNKGISINYLESKFNINFYKKYKGSIEKNLNKNFINLDNGYFKLTDKGRMFSNQVELDFYTIKGE